MSGLNTRERRRLYMAESIIAIVVIAFVGGIVYMNYVRDTTQDNLYVKIIPKGNNTRVLGVIYIESTIIEESMIFGYEWTKIGSTYIIGSIITLYIDLWHFDDYIAPMEYKIGRGLEIYEYNEFRVYVESNWKIPERG